MIRVIRHFPPTPLVRILVYVHTDIVTKTMASYNPYRLLLNLVIILSFFSVVFGRKHHLDLKVMKRRV